MITFYKHISTCVAVVAAVLAVATLPALGGSTTPWYVLVAGYGVLAVWCAIVLKRRGELATLVRPKSGDLTLGIVSGLVLAGSAFFVLRFVAPLDDARSGWLFNLYAQFGDVQGEVPRAAALLMVVAFEEVVWRGLVQTQCVDTLGARRGLLAAAALYALAHAPTAFTLQHAAAGPNPLLLVGALGCGLVWGVIVLLTGRLTPALVCHAVVSYFVSAPAPAWLW